MYLAIFAYGSLGFLISWALSGPKKEIAESPSGPTTGGVPSIEDPGWADFVSGNNGNNMELYFLSLDKK